VVQSADALVKTASADVDGDGDVDLVTVDATVIAGDGSRVRTVTATNTDGSVRSLMRETLEADKVSAETWVDLNQDGVFQATDLVRQVTVGAGQARTETTWARNPDGSVRAVSVAVTSADGLVTNSTVDADGDGDTDSAVSDVTTIAGGVATRVVQVTNQNGGLRSREVTTTSADGLTVTQTVDIDGSGTVDARTVDARVLNGDGSITRTVSDYAGDGTTLTGRTVRVESADRRVVTVTTDANGDGATDRVVNSTEAADGSKTLTETSFYANGAVAAKSVTVTSANGLVSTTTQDANGDLVNETVLASSTVLNTNGSRVQTVDVNNGDGSNRTLSVTTVSDDRLVVTAQSDLNGDNLFDRTTASTKVLNVDGSVTETVQSRAQNAALLSQVQTTVSDDGLVTTTRSDADGDGDFDLVTTETLVLMADGGRTQTSELRTDAGVLRAKMTTISTDDARLLTVSSDINGDGQTDRLSTRTIDQAGQVTATTSQLSALGALQSRSEVITSDDGLSATQSWDRNGDGTYERRTMSTTVLNADGSTTMTSVSKGANGTTNAQSVVTVSDDGLISIRTDDLDGDGTAEFTTSQSRVIAANGVVTDIAQTVAEGGGLINRATTVTSADERTVTQSVDLDGNGTNDRVTVTTVANSGLVTSTTSFLSAGGALEGTLTRTISGDGLLKVTAQDTNGDGRADLTSVDRTVLLASGEATRSLVYTNERNQIVGQEQSFVSDDGNKSTVALDLNGDQVFEFRTDTTRTYAANGDVVVRQATKDATDDTISDVVTTVSGNGLKTTVVTDFTGDGNADRNVTLTKAADGSWSEVTTLYYPGARVTETLQRSQSADGRTLTTTRDLNGDGKTDRSVVVVTDLSSNLQVDYKDVRLDGTRGVLITEKLSANGMNHSFTFDVDNDSKSDFARFTDLTFNADGSSVETFREVYEANAAIYGTYGAKKEVYSEVTTRSANGLQSVKQIDADGDGVVDATTTDTTTIGLDGSRTKISETRYADGDLRARFQTVTSADGRQTTTTADYDGNGIADKISESRVLADGSRQVVDTSFGQGGAKIQTFITTTSADGLVTKITRGAVEQVITRSAVDPDSYTWSNGVAATTSSTNVVVSHQIDALGIETWTMTSKWYVSTTLNTTVSTVRLDAAAKERVLAEAARIFDTILDRDLDVTEIEMLVPKIANGQLDEVALATELLASSEFVTRYGTLSNAEFVTQVYLNAFGRVPSLVELSDGLTGLAAGSISRAKFAAGVSEGIEHSVVGNEHQRTSAYDANATPGGAASSTGSHQGGYANSGSIAASGSSGGDRSGPSSFYLSELGAIGTDSDRHFANGYSYMGYGHRSTNNVDVIMNPPVFERSLDEAYVTFMVKNLVDVVYDRAATAQEAAYLKGLLLKGTDNPDDIAAKLLAVKGELQGVASNSLFGKTGADLVEQGFVNALGRQPTAQEQAIWEAHLSSGRITVAQFVATLAMSMDHLSVGPDSVATVVPTVTTLTGTSAANSLTGTAGQDLITGLEGNDTIVAGDGSDRVIGGLGADILWGTNTTGATAANGSDTYVWAKGDGNDTINDWGQSLLETDTLELTNVTSTEVALTAVGTDLRVTIVPTGEAILIDERFQNVGYGYGIERIVFSDGVIWNLEDILQRARLNGDAAANTLTGSVYQDNFYGLEGNDTLNGSDGNDLLVGGLGNDGLNGGNGGDTYVWTKGEGSDTIGDTGASLAEVDILHLTNATAADIDLYRQSNSNNLRVVVSTGPGTTSEILVTDHFLNTASGVGIEGIRFADGTIWTRADIVARTNTWGTDSAGNMNSTANNDRLYGAGGNDTLNGGEGDDYLRGENDVDSLLGGNGSDTYDWFKGHANDTINDTGASLFETDLLKLSNVASNDVLLSRTNSSNNLTVRIISTGETITVASQFAATTSGVGIERISFSDGVSWDKQDILARTRLEGTSAAETLTGVAYRDNLFGLAGNDTLNGNDGDDVLVGGAGVDSLAGGNGSDIYEWSKGEGNDTINESGLTAGEVDTLILKDVASSGAVLARSGVNLTVTVPQTGEVITVLNRFATTGGLAGVEAIQFSDGVVTRILQDQVALFATTGTTAAEALTGTIYADSISGLAGNDTLTGGDGNDILTGGAGNDSLVGGNGADGYVWTKGEGNDTINDAGPLMSETDRLTLTNVVSTDVQLTRANGSTNLIIRVISTGEIITVAGRLGTTLSGAGIETINFADGVTWSLTDILAATKLDGTTAAETLTGTAWRDNMSGLDGNDVLNGGDGDDVLIGGAGADSLAGSNGNESYEWSKGQGNDTINDAGASLTEVDTLVLKDVASTDVVTLSRANGSADVTLLIASTNETLRLTGQYSAVTSGAGIERIVFSDGVVWLLDEIQNRVTSLGGTGNDSLTGTGFDDVLRGLAGVDTLTGGAGDDTLDGGIGNDTLDGGTGNDVFEWRQGDGTDSLSDTGTSRYETDILRLVGIATSAVDLYRLSGSNDLRVEISDGTGGKSTVIVRNHFLDPLSGVGIEGIQFDDGTLWTQTNILAWTRTNGTGNNNNNFIGSASNDRMFGNAGDDTLDGGAGDDYLIGGTGVDKIYGGAGFDKTSYYDDSTQGVLIDLRVTSAQVGVAGGIEVGDILQSIEWLEGTYYSDTLHGNDESNYLLGGNEADLLYGYDGYDQLRGGTGFDTIYGGDGADDIRGDHNSDSLFGGAGGDTIEGGSFHDAIYGGTGDDFIISGTGNDTLWGEQGEDTFHFVDQLFQTDVVMDFEDGIDRLWFAPLSADDMSDFTITGNGTTSVTLALGANTLVLNGVAPISLTVDDFLFA
jgi:Ca2+-binding RTX toxin-like protein